MPPFARLDFQACDWSSRSKLEIFLSWRFKNQGNFLLGDSSRAFGEFNCLPPKLWPPTFRTTTNERAFPWPSNRRCRRAHDRDLRVRHGSSCDLRRSRDDRDQARSPRAAADPYAWRPWVLAIGRRRFQRWTSRWAVPWVERSSAASCSVHSGRSSAGIWAQTSARVRRLHAWKTRRSASRD